MRKFVLAAAAMCAFVGFTIAAEVVFVNYDKDKSELTVREDGKETTYKVTSSTEFKVGEKSLANDKATARLEKMAQNEKVKGKAKFEITAEGSTLKEVKFKAPKKKDK